MGNKEGAYNGVNGEGTRGLIYILCAVLMNGGLEECVRAAAAARTLVIDINGLSYEDATRCERPHSHPRHLIMFSYMSSFELFVLLFQRKILFLIY